MFSVKIILKDNSVHFVSNISSFSRTDFEIIFLCIDSISSTGSIRFCSFKFDISSIHSIIFQEDSIK